MMIQQSEKSISEEVLTKEKADIRPSAALSPMRGC
jgi:hypothetical protein